MRIGTDYSVPITVLLIYEQPTPHPYPLFDRCLYRLLEAVYVPVYARSIEHRHYRGLSICQTE